MGGAKLPANPSIAVPSVFGLGIDKNMLRPKMPKNTAKSQGKGAKTRLKQAKKAALTIFFKAQSKTHDSFTALAQIVRKALSVDRERDWTRR